MKVFRKLWNVISTLLVVAMVLLAFALVGVRLIGLTPYAVLSGSMEPTYHVGSLIYVKDIDPADIEIGDPITFVVNEDLLLATHRVVDIEIFYTKHVQVLDENDLPVFDEKGNPVLEEVPLDEPSYYYQTKGDANDAVDGSAVYYKNVVGTPVFSIPQLGYLSSYLQTKKGMIMGISVALVLIILTFLPDLLNMVDDEPKKDDKNKDKKDGDGKDDGNSEEASEEKSEDKPETEPKAE